MEENNYSYDLSKKPTDLANLIELLPDGTIIIRDVNKQLIQSSPLNCEVSILVRDEQEARKLYSKFSQAVESGNYNYLISDLEDVESYSNYKYTVFTVDSYKFLIIFADDTSIKTHSFINTQGIKSFYSVVNSKNGVKFIDIVGTFYSEASVEKVISDPDSNHNNSYLTINSVFLDVQHYLSELDKLSNQTNSSDSKDSTKETKMTTDKISFADRFKNNAIEGAYQGAARVAIDTFIEGIILTMKKSGVDESSIMIATAFLKSDVGTAIVSGAIGASVPYVPVDVMNNPVVEKIADKCVQNAVADSSELMANIAMKYVKPALEAAVSSFNKAAAPAITGKLGIFETEVPKVRVTKEASSEKVSSSSIDDLSDEEILMLMEKRRSQSATRLH